MKQILLFLLITSLMGCQKKNVDPVLPANDSLYKTWRLTRVWQDGKFMDYTPNKFVVTFPRDGNFFGSQSPISEGSCCSPVAFEGTNTTIRFIWVAPASGCATVLCLINPLTGGVTWQITTLNDTSLVLTGGNTILVFDA